MARKRTEAEMEELREQQIKRISGMSERDKEIFFEAFKSELEILKDLDGMPFPLPNGDFDYPYRNWTGSEYGTPIGPISLVDIIASWRNISPEETDRMVREAVKDIDSSDPHAGAAYSKTKLLLDQLINFMTEQHDRLTTYGSDISTAYKPQWAFNGPVRIESKGSRTSYQSL